MNHQTAAETYRRAALENAPPIKIIRLLYQAAIRSLDQATATEPQDPDSAFLDLVDKADSIVCELRLALDHGQDAEVAANLERLYLFVEERLGQAALGRTAEPLAEARQVLCTLLEAWNQVELSAEQVA